MPRLQRHYQKIIILSTTPLKRKEMTSLISWVLKRLRSSLWYQLNKINWNWIYAVRKTLFQSLFWHLRKLPRYVIYQTKDQMEITKKASRSHLFLTMCSKNRISAILRASVALRHSTKRQTKKWKEALNKMNSFSKFPNITWLMIHSNPYPLNLQTWALTRSRTTSVIIRRALSLLSRMEQARHRRLRIKWRRKATTPSVKEYPLMVLISCMVIEGAAIKKRGRYIWGSHSIWRRMNKS